MESLDIDRDAPEIDIIEVKNADSQTLEPVFSENGTMRIKFVIS